MPRGLPENVKHNVTKCREAALAAVDAYNRPGPRFRTAQYLVLIVIAWTALFHAVFYKQRKQPWYRSKKSGTGRGVRYQYIDGEPRHWDLDACLNEYFGSNNPPERQNLAFLIGLRNKIEHRRLPQLDASLYGECQAALLNLVEYLVAKFGPKYALEEQLAVSLQFSKVMPAEKKQAAQKLANSAAKDVTDYVEKFRGKLPATVLNSMKYSYNVFLVPRVVNRENAADAAVQFIKLDEATPEEMARLKDLNVLIREKHVPIANPNLLKPTKVLDALRDRVPYRVTMNTHTIAWAHFAVRPPKGSRSPDKTDTKYCVFDEPHGDYLYTEQWVDKLATVLSDAASFMKITGRDPVAQ